MTLYFRCKFSWCRFNYENQKINKCLEKRLKWKMHKIIWTCNQTHTRRERHTFVLCNWKPLWKTIISKFVWIRRRRWQWRWWEGRAHTLAQVSSSVFSKPFGFRFGCLNIFQDPRPYLQSTYSFAITTPAALSALIQSHYELNDERKFFAIKRNENEGLLMKNRLYLW